MAAQTDPIYDLDTGAQGKGVGYLIDRARTEILTAVDRELAQSPELAELEITAAQYLILKSLAAGEAESTSQLCKQRLYDPGAMTRMVDRLEAKGLVHRTRCPNDRRVVNLELTEEGRAAMPRMKVCAVKVVNRFLGGFSKDEVRQLEVFLTRLIQNA